MKETVTTSGFSVRMKVEGGKISELETVILRRRRHGRARPGENPFNKGVFVDKPILQQDVPPNLRRPRERMISLADGYFDTLQLNDGTLFTEFDPACNRTENGLQTTNNPAQAARLLLGTRLRRAVQAGHLSLRRSPARAALPAGR